MWAGDNIKFQNSVADAQLIQVKRSVCYFGEKAIKLWGINNSLDLGGCVPYGVYTSMSIAFSNLFFGYEFQYSKSVILYYLNVSIVCVFLILTIIF